MRPSLWAKKTGPNLSEDLFYCSSPNFGPKMGPNLSEDLFLIYLLVLHLILGTRHRSSYPLKKFLSEALGGQTGIYD